MGVAEFSAVAAATFAYGVFRLSAASAAMLLIGSLGSGVSG